MSHIIFKILVEGQPRYFEWSTNVDGPVSLIYTLPQFKNYIKGRYGEKAFAELPARLERVKKYGTSSLDCEGVRSYITEAGEKEIIEQLSM